LVLIMSMSEQNCDVGGLARADLEINRHCARLVDQVMAVAGAFRKGCAIAGAQYRFAVIFDQGQLAFNHIHEFVFVRMPVTLARPVARRQAHEIDTVVSKPAGVTQPLPYAFGTGGVEWRRIAGAPAFWYGGDVDLGHDPSCQRPLSRRTR
jgi:hypothetical protein